GEDVHERRNVAVAGELNPHHDEDDGGEGSRDGRARDALPPLEDRHREGSSRREAWISTSESIARSVIDGCTGWWLKRATSKSSVSDRAGAGGIPGRPTASSGYSNGRSGGRPP